MMLHSIVEYYAAHEGYKCGYCKKSDTNFSHGMWAHALTVSDYQDLIDRGWRRSGKYCYKPTLSVTCCPMYTIRCRALEFKASKSQKKVLKKFNKYLNGDETSEKQVADRSRKMSTCSLEDDIVGEEFVETNKTHQEIDIESVKEAASQSQHQFIEQEETADDVIEDFKLGISNLKSEDCQIKKGVGADPNKAPCKKAKLLRREKRLEKLKEKGVDVNSLLNRDKNREKQVEDLLNELPHNLQNRLEVKLVRTAPPSPEWQATSTATYKVYKKYQITIHRDKPEKCTEPKFRDFLVSSPLLEERSETGPPCGYGSFHQQYWLDGNLIAVGVIDILPKCISSVYFFYDPEYSNLTLGTYGALREIAFTRHLHSVSPELQYYYMGFYIHQCRKMRYKGHFAPSDLLCPETYKWFPIEECLTKLEISPYARFNPDIDSLDENCPKDNDLNYIPILVKGVIQPYKTYRRKFAKNNKNEDELIEYMKLVGMKCARALILVR